MIKLENCPYCIKALQAVEELKKEQLKYSNIELEIIDENKMPDIASKYAKDYYYVPSLFVDADKIYEANPADDYNTIKHAVEHWLEAGI